MTIGRSQVGFSLLEVLVSLAVMSVAATVTAAMLIENSKMNRAQQARAQVQSSARSTLSLVVQKLRTAGWDPTDAGITSVGLDTDPSDPVDYIDIFADLNADGDVADAGESITIRHVGDRVEWRETSTASYEIVGVGLTNDADGDGTPEPMFTPDANPGPTRITVRVTAASASVDVHTGEPIRYTVTSDVILRNED